MIRPIPKEVKPKTVEYKYKEGKIKNDNSSKLPEVIDYNKEKRERLKMSSTLFTILKVISVVGGFLGIAVALPEGGADAGIWTQITFIVYAALSFVEKFFIKKEVREEKI